MNTEKATIGMNTGTRYNTRTTRLCDSLLQDIREGRFQQGAFLPAESSLAETYSVSRSTIRKAVDILVRNNKLEKTPHHGVKVRENLAVAEIAQIPDTTTNTSTVRSTLAIVMSGTINHSESQKCEGFREYAEHHHLDVCVYIDQHDHNSTLEIMSHIEHLADALVIYPYDMPEYVEAVKRLQSINFPLVMFRALTGVKTNLVTSNDLAGAYQAVNYLIEKYHRPVYFLTDDSPRQLRAKAFACAMRDAGFGDRIESMIFTIIGAMDKDPKIWGEEKSPCVGVEASRSFLKTITLPASVYCVNDYVAASLYTAAQERGIVIGKELMIVGTDDLPLAKFLTPTLTTLHAHTKDIGYEAAKLLHKVILGKVQKPVQMALPYKFIIRESA
jgi:LacI family transcriptional regulator